MAKKKNNKSAKSLIMLVATGLTLVVATLCWFSIMDRSEIEKLDNVIVKNENSSKAKIYYGADENGNIVASSDEISKYCQVDGNEILLENMVPGAEYSYKAVFPSCSEGQTITLTFTGVQDNGLAEKIEVYGNVSSFESDDNIINDTNHATEMKLEKLRNGDIKVIESEIKSKGKYVVYFSFKFSDDAELSTTENSIGYENKSLKITSIDAVVSSTAN
ncbi:MAG: hypothetical protein E7536_03580 [Ruminococcaceae bacterium]|nr:hypothetical protein [Oscillospiraceae bacterium]